MPNTGQTAALYPHNPELMHPDRVIARRPVSPEMNAIIGEVVLGANVERLLDLGAGNGRIGSAALEISPGLEVISLEADERLVIDGLSHAEELNFIKGSIGELPFPDNHFGAVTAVNVLHEAAARYSNEERFLKFDEAISEIARVLDAGGRLLLTDGFMPLNSDSEAIVSSKSEAAEELLSKFVKEYVAQKLHISEIPGDKDTKKMDIFSLMNLVTKFVYLFDEDLWNAERHQVYPFIDIGSAIQITNNHGLIVESIKHPTPNQRAGVKKLLEHFDVSSDGEKIDQVNFPACQTYLTFKNQKK